MKEVSGVIIKIQTNGFSVLHHEHDDQPLFVFERFASLVCHLSEAFNLGRNQREFHDRFFHGGNDECAPMTEEAMRDELGTVRYERDQLRANQTSISKAAEELRQSAEHWRIRHSDIAGKLSAALDELSKLKHRQAKKESRSRKRSR